MQEKEIVCFRCNKKIVDYPNNKYVFCPYCGEKNINDYFDEVDSLINNKIEQMLSKVKEYVVLKKFDKAMESLELILELSPNNVEANYVIEQIKKIPDDLIFEENVSINRTKQSYGELLSPTIVIDDKFIGKLAYDGSMKTTCELGTHVLQVKNSLYKTKEVVFDINNRNEKIVINVKFKSPFSNKFNVEVIKYPK
jgi:hypothetical protein